MNYNELLDLVLEGAYARRLKDIVGDEEITGRNYFDKYRAGKKYEKEFNEYNPVDRMKHKQDTEKEIAWMKKGSPSVSDAQLASHAWDSERESKDSWMKYASGKESPLKKAREKKEMYLKRKYGSTHYPTKESADGLKLEIFESCRYGEITEEERDDLLNILD